MQNTLKENDLEADFARNIILVNQFYKLVNLGGTTCRVIPLKGISLLLSLYKNNYSRNVGDIDLFVDENQVDDFINKLKATGYSPRNSETHTSRLKSKRKFDMVHSDPRYCDLDIHVDLITKKFFRITTGDFTSFALQRLRKTDLKGSTVYLLSPVDEWLYLAQHYCFHLFSGKKWLSDLYLLQSGFSDKEICELVEIARKYHFERIVTAVSICLKNNYEKEKIKIPVIVEKKYCIFELLLRKSNARFTNIISDRIIAAFWEFVFIDSAKSRIYAYMHLLFPPSSVFQSIYHFHSRFFLLLYPFHLLLVLLASVLFFSLLWIKGNKNSDNFTFPYTINL
jgi:hypothetical protein